MASVLLLARERWWRKRSATLAIALAAGIMLASFASRTPIDLCGAVARYQPVLELLVGIGLLRRVLARIRLQAALSQIAGRLSGRLRAPLLFAIAGVLAGPLSIAAVAILCTGLAEVVRPRIATAVLSMRAVSATMLILPTTAGAAVISASMPDLDRLSVLRIGLPLFVLALLAALRLDIAVVNSSSGKVALRALWPIATFWMLLAAFILLVGLHGSEATALAGISTFTLDAVIGRRNGGTIVEDLQEAIGGLASELLLLSACGLLTGFLAYWPLPASVQNAVHGIAAIPATAIGLVLFVLPAFSMLGVHPIILFSVMFPLVDGALLGSRPLQYLVWSTMFASAQLVSPVSTSARLAAASLGVGSEQTSFRIHGIYTAGMAMIVWAYVLGLRN